MRVLLAAFGTRGDVQPLLTLAAALRARGHAPLVCAPPNFARLAEEAGVAFVPLGSDSKAFLERAQQRPSAAMTLLKEEIAAHFGALLAAAEVHAPEVVIGTASAVAAGSIAEKAGAAYRYLAVSPQALPSSAHPPPYVPWPALPGWANVTTWGAVRTVFNVVGRGTLNRLRAAIGLPPLRDVLEAVLPRAALVISDPVLATLPDDLAGLATQVPYFLSRVDDQPALPDDVQAFLHAGAPPIYVGFGSMNDRSPVETTAEILAGARAVGSRVLLASGWAGLGAAVSGEDVLVVRSELPHARVFPYVAAVVHHGGSGTTHEATRAAVPQVVVPHFLDQPWWAMRVKTLGLGPAGIPKRRLTARRLERALRTALSEGVRQRARSLGAQLRTDGVEQACRLVETLSRRSTAPGTPPSP